MASRRVRRLSRFLEKRAQEPRTNEGGMMMDLIYLSIGVLFFIGCVVLTRAIERL